MANHDVISAFLDDEPFDPQALSAALADPEGRALLIDLVALRGLTQPDDPLPAPVRTPGLVASPRRVLAIAAALTLALVGGYRWGERSGTVPMDPPAPTRVISSQADWQDVTEGGSR